MLQAYNLQGCPASMWVVLSLKKQQPWWPTRGLIPVASIQFTRMSSKYVGILSKKNRGYLVVEFMLKE